MAIEEVLNETTPSSLALGQLQAELTALDVAVDAVANIKSNKSIPVECLTTDENAQRWWELVIRINFVLASLGGHRVRLVHKIEKLTGAGED